MNIHIYIYHLFIYMYISTHTHILLGKRGGGRARRGVTI